MLIDRREEMPHRYLRAMNSPRSVTEWGKNKSQGNVKGMMPCINTSSNSL